MLSKNTNKRTIILFMTDGDDNSDTSQVCHNINTKFKDLITHFLLIGYGNSDFPVLKQMESKLPGGKHTKIYDPSQLEAKFKEVALIIP